MQPEAVISADVGGSFINAAIVDRSGGLVRKLSVPTPARDYPAFVEALRGIVASYADALPPRTPLALAIAGFVDPETGHATCANVPCVGGRPLASDLSIALGRPVAVANDADCFVVAEALAGAGRDHRIVFGVILGTGVGGGLVVDGRLVEGTAGISGEWGHGPILAQHTGSGRMIPRFQCGCGRKGCVDTIGGARGLERLDAYLNDVGLRDSRSILAAWQAGEPAAGETVRAYLDLVADPLALVLNVTGAGIVPVGGGLGGAPALRDALDRAVRARMLRSSDTPVLVPARFGGDAGLIGAALLTMRTGRER
jgi:N-acetylglucosamine kinase